MDRTVAAVLATAIGAGIAMQAPLNSQLGRTVGGLQASMFALAVSFVCLTTLVVITGGLGGLGRLDEPPLYVVFGGGVLGAIYVGSIVFTVRELGATGLTAATISGQLVFALVMDNFGWLGLTKSPVTTAKLAGVALLAAGTWLVIRD
jgi:bacterial/archaeal transporter family-2 protein